MAAVSPPERPIRPVCLFIQGRPPVYTHALKVKLPLGNKSTTISMSEHPPWLKNSLDGEELLMGVQAARVGQANVNDNDISDAEDGLRWAICRQEAGTLQEYEDDAQPLPSEPSWDSEGEDELTGDEADIMAEATQLAMDRDEETDDKSGESDEDSDVESGSEGKGGGNDSDYVPNQIRGRYRRHSMSITKNKKGKGAEHNKTAKDEMKKRTLNKKPLYKFCPLLHCLSILRLLAKHFCQHPLLPERHGQPRSAQQIHRDAVYETYLHCKNNQLREVWGYLWTNWYAADKWKLWACSAYPYAIPRKRTTMVVEAMWCNFKRLVLHSYNRPRVDFATYALVTQALPPYRRKLNRILDDPRKGRASFLNGEQVPIKKAWLTLLEREIKGQYETDVLMWTCSCGAQKYHSYLLCKHLVQKLPRPDANWWTTIVRRHTPPFYDIHTLLSPEDRARAPEPEELGNCSWLARMPGETNDPGTPVVSTPLYVRLHLGLSTP